MAGKDAAAKPNKSREKRPPRRALFFVFTKNARTAAIGLSFELHFDYNQTKRKELRDLCLTNQTHKKKKVHNHPRTSRFHQSQSKQPAPWPALRSAVWPARSARSWAESSVLSQEKPPQVAGRSFLLLGRGSPRLLNGPNRGPQKSVRAVRGQRKDPRQDRLPQNRGNVRSAADEQQKAAEDRNLRGVVASGAARAAARTGQGWIRTSEGVKPADLQSAPFGHSGTYPRLRALI